MNTCNAASNAWKTVIAHSEPGKGHRDVQFQPPDVEAGKACIGRLLSYSIRVTPPSLTNTLSPSIYTHTTHIKDVKMAKLLLCLVATLCIGAASAGESPHV